MRSKNYMENGYGQAKIWTCQASDTNCVCVILREVDVELDVVHLRAAHFKVKEKKPSDCPRL